MEFPIGLKKVATLTILRGSQGFLLLKRSKEPHLGKYIPIGGKVEPFETPRSGAIREIAEETGISLTELKYCGFLVETSPTKFNWVSFIYSSEVELESLPNTDEGQLEWVPERRIPEIPTPETDRFIYFEVARGSTFAFDAEYDANLNLLVLNDLQSGLRLFERGVNGV